MPTGNSQNQTGDLILHYKCTADPKGLTADAEHRLSLVIKDCNALGVDITGAQVRILFSLVACLSLSMPTAAFFSVCFLPILQTCMFAMMG